MLFSSLHLKGMIHWAVYSQTWLRLHVFLVQRYILWQKQHANVSQRSYKTKRVLSRTTTGTAGRLPLVPSGTQCKEKHCCYYRIFYNDISLLSTGICQWLFIKPRCNVRFLQDASANHKVSKDPAGGSHGSCLMKEDGEERGKGRRVWGSLTSSHLSLQRFLLLRHRKTTSQADWRNLIKIPASIYFF